MLKAIHSMLYCCGVAGGAKQFILGICPQKDIFSSITVKPCHEAIKEVFLDKFHILAVMGRTVAMAMILA